LRERWRVVSIRPDGRSAATAPQSEREARRLFDRLAALRPTLIVELQCRTDGAWQTVERSGIRIAPGTEREGRSRV
jgi:hypothetical protein